MSVQPTQDEVKSRQNNMQILFVHVQLYRNIQDSIYPNIDQPYVGGGGYGSSCGMYFECTAYLNNGFFCTNETSPTTDKNSAQLIDSISKQMYRRESL